MQTALSFRPPSPAPSPAALHALADEVRPLLPVPRHDRRHLLRDEAALLVDRLLVQVARGSGAISVAMGECLDALSSGDGPMRLGYSGLGDYARERLSMAGRRALELARLARELRGRPLLRAAVRAGEVSERKARAVLTVAVGNSEAEWVARARGDTVRALEAAVEGGAGVDEEQGLERVAVELGPDQRRTVCQGLSLAGKLIGVTAPRWRRLEALCQEYLGAHPDQADDEGGPGDNAGKPDWAGRLAGLLADQPAPDLRAWLEDETGRWSYLHRAEPVAAPEAGVDDLDRARRIDARLCELAAMRRGWDEFLGQLCLLLTSLGLWRDMGFRDLGHYAAERLGMSARAVEQRAWLERRMWELPDLRRALREGRLGYEKARQVARCTQREYLDAWIELAEKLTCIELIRAVEADTERQMCARKILRLEAPEDVRRLFEDACRAVRAAEGRRTGSGECLVVLARHFLEVNGRNTPARRVWNRDRGLCAVPGCSRAAAHAHHIEYRSQGGTDDPSNLVSLCAAHHLHGVHKGYVRVRGRAPDDLHWELGE